VRPAVPWLTAAALAVLLSFADGFWLTSLQGAIGAIERAQDPFASWWRGSAVMTPVFFVAVLGALALARHRYGTSLRGRKVVVATGLLVAAAATVVGIGDLVASSAYDYHLQSDLIQLSQSTRAGAAAVTGVHATGGSMAGMDMGDTASQLRATLVVHARGVAYASAALLVTNVLLVAWVVALRGADWETRRRPTTAELRRTA